MSPVTASVLLLPILLISLQESAEAQKQSYLALGDSYTIGEKVPEDYRWPVILTGRLNELGYTFSPPDIVAVTGWTTGELMQGISEADPDASYDLVSLLIGVNNQYRGYDIEIFEQEFEKLLSLAIGFAGGRADRVLVLSIPDYGVTPFGENRNPVKISGEIDRYNRIKRSITERKGALFVDITPISRMAEHHAGLLAEDRLHPSGRMYKRWVDKALTILLPEMEHWKIPEE